MNEVRFFVRFCVLFQHTHRALPYGGIAFFVAPYTAESVRTDPFTGRFKDSDTQLSEVGGAGWNMTESCFNSLFQLADGDAIRRIRSVRNSKICAKL